MGLLSKQLGTPKDPHTRPPGAARRYADRSGGAREHKKLGCLASIAPKLHASRPELREQQDKQRAFRVPLRLGRVLLLPCVSIVLLLALVVANSKNVV